jgi:mRNA interferase HigB
MRVTTKKRLEQFGKKYADARVPLQEWLRVAKAAKWKSIDDVREDFPAADGVPVKSGKTATVFNIKGNHYRLITAIHYSTFRVFTMRFMTHAEYGKGTWKDSL